MTHRILLSALVWGTIAWGPGASAKDCSKCDVEQRFAVSNAVGNNAVSIIQDWDACFVFADFLGVPGVTNFRCQPDAVYFDVIDDDTALLHGTVTLDSGPGTPGTTWSVQMEYSLRGQGVAGEGSGGAKTELQGGTQPPATVAQWHYYDLNSGGLYRVGSDEHVTLTQYPAGGVHPLQIGMTANGKNLNLGASEWFLYTHFVDGQAFMGLGDLTADFAVAAVPPCLAWNCVTGDACMTPICGANVGECGAQPKCDDGSACTENICDAATGACSFVGIQPIGCEDLGCLDREWNAATCTCETTVDADDCDDNNNCTADECNAATGFCTSTSILCNDGDACTIDFCDPATGQCSSVGSNDPNCCAPPVGGCSDGNVCTTDQWSALTCSCVFTPSNGPGCCETPPFGCSDGNQCTTDQWSLATCSCVHTPNNGPGCCGAPAAGCSDGNPCTTDQWSTITCECVYTPNNTPGCCQPPAVGCSDGNPCTTDTWNANTCSCVYTPNNAPGCCQPPAGGCNDGNSCTTDSWSQATCSCMHTPINGPGCCDAPAAGCSDGDPCTTDQWSTVTCQCVYTPNGAPGCCQPPANGCADNNPCSIDQWSLALCACVYTPTDGPDCCEPPANGCNDGDLCTNDQWSQATCQCVFTPTGGPNCCEEPAGGCTDGNVCTTDQWSQTTCQCVYTPIASPECCEEPAGGCPNNGCLEGGWNEDTCSCDTTPNPGACDDGDPCTADTCDEATGECGAGPTCLAPDACSEVACDSATGECKPPTSKVCPDDGNFCTIGMCQPSSGGCEQVDFCQPLTYCPQEPEVPAHGCGDVPLMGRCVTSVVERCLLNLDGENPTYIHQFEDCAARDMVCGWDTTSETFDCVPPGDTPFDCRLIPDANSCEGDRLSLCGASGTPEMTDCTDLGLNCGWTGNRYDCIPPALCVPRCLEGACGSDGCGGVCSPDGCGAGLSCVDGKCCNCDGPAVPTPDSDAQFDRLLGGPTCTASNTGGTGTGGIMFMLALTMALLWRRQRSVLSGRGRSMVPVVVVVTLCVLAAPTLRAQTPQEGFSLQRFTPVPHTDRVFNVEGTNLAMPLRPSATVFLHLMKEPLRYNLVTSSAQTNEERVDRFLGGELGIGLGLLSFLDVQAILPFKLDGDGNQAVFSKVDQSGVGDIVLRARLAAMDRATYDGVGLTFNIGAAIPAGDPDTMTASQHTAFQFGAAGTYETGRWLMAVNAGLDLRKNQRIAPNLLIGDEFRYGIGATVRALEWLRFGAEVFGAVSLETTQEGNNPVELAAGPRFMISPNLQIDVGVGAGLTDGVGAPDWRVFTGLSWSMGAPVPEPAPIAAVCGNGKLEAGEECDNKALFAEGTCNPTDCLVVVAEAEPLPDVPACGNGIVDSDLGEECDKKLHPDWCDDQCKRIPVSVALAPVFFDTDIYDPRSASEPIMVRNAEKLLTNDDVRFRIRGYADVRAPTQYNCWLSKARVSAVMKQLMERGISRQRMVIEWVGDTQPDPPGRDAKSLQLNRRVDFELLGDASTVRPFLCRGTPPKKFRKAIAPLAGARAADGEWSPEGRYLNEAGTPAKVQRDWAPENDFLDEP
ncbi:MAG: outer membrane protein OmpA-like peptidoglycan-associated protein [Myxococcota bacterium]|jgi:outer membrane protein OmpA-like peptidoglycan-associated protein